MSHISPSSWHLPQWRWTSRLQSSLELEKVWHRVLIWSWIRRHSPEGMWPTSVGLTRDACSLGPASLLTESSVMSDTCVCRLHLQSNVLYLYICFIQKHLLCYFSVHDKHEQSFLKQITSPLKEPSENICTGTSGNGRKFSISAWRAMNVFQVLQRDEQRIESCNLQTLTEFMESSSKWFSLPKSSPK